MPTRRLDDKVIIIGILTSFCNDEERNVNHLNFNDGQGSSFNCTIGPDKQIIHLGVEGHLKIRKDKSGSYKLCSSSLDKHDQVTHVFFKIDENGKRIRDVINEEVSIITNSDIDFFTINGIYNISFEFNLY